MLENVFSQLGFESEDKKQQKVAAELLYKVVAPLQASDEQYPAQIFDYIWSGQHPEILMTLQSRQNDDVAILLGQPATLNWWSVSPSSQFLAQNNKKLINQSKNARVNFYNHIGTGLSFEQTVRFGKFLVAATREQNITRLNAEVPSWLIYLMIDGLHSSLGDHTINKNMQFRKNWSVQMLHELLEQEQLEGTLILNALFDRDNMSEYYWRNLDLFYRLPDLKDYIQQHSDAFSTLYQRLSANGQLNLFNYLELYPKVAKQFPSLIVSCAVSSSKKVRSAAQSMLAGLEEQDVQQYLAERLANAAPKERGYAADLLARLGTVSQATLEHALTQEKSKTVIQTIEQALARLASLDRAEQQDQYDIPSYEPIQFVRLPEQTKDILLQNYRDVLAKAKQDAEAEIEQNKQEKWKSKWRQQRCASLEKLNEATIFSYFDVLNAEVSAKKKDLDQEIIFYKQRLSQLPEYNLIHFLIAMGHRYIREGRMHLSTYALNDCLKAEDYAKLDLRQLRDAIQKAGIDQADQSVAYFLLQSNYDDALDRLAPEHVWPFFAEQPDFLAEALGLLPSQLHGYYESYNVAAALQILGYFPQLPTQFIPRLLELALGESKSYRLQAQQLLQRLPDIRLRAEEGLASSKQEIRIVAAEWLVRLNDVAAIAALQTALKKEKREVVIAALLTALEKLGEDISAHLSPEHLLKDAEKGLKAKLPTSLKWLLDQSFPALTWQDGSAVSETILRWWVVLAHKLKDPVGNALFQRYLSLLSLDSQQQLGEFLFAGFAHQDIRSPSQQEALAEAEQHAPARLNNYQDSFKRYGQKYPEYYGRYEHITLEQVIEEIKREVLSRYLGSAISDKGILALSSGIQGHKAVRLLQQYMKDHYQRRAQIEAMLAAISNSSDPLIIQFLLSIARRYRTASVQEKARQYIEVIAERNGWSNDELADRTIPTAGFDEQGVLSLSFGEREFTVVLDDQLKMVLKNEEGKVIKALPAPRQTDDADLVKETKKQFSSSKKELKQIIDLQTARLYEAMCANRHWTVNDWQQYLAEHPVMRLLIQRLVWQEMAQGEVLNTFRPTEDGSLINADDDEVELSQDSEIRLAHAALMDADEIAAWQQHYKDYKVKGLFKQLDHVLPELELANKDQIDDHLGWMTDTFTLRGTVTKLGYQRGQAEDGGVFEYYYKTFNSLGISAFIYFSGSYFPEENMPAVLYRLSFSKVKGRSWHSSDMQLKDVPPILFAECYADYLAVAAACRGFDPEWQKKTPW